MGLRESPFSNRFLGGLDTAARDLLYPTYWLLNKLLCLQRTTEEKRTPQRPPYALQVLLKGPPFLLLLLLSAPFSLLGFLLWLPLQAARRPFAYRHTPSPCRPAQWVLPGKAKAFRFLSGNVCLLPDGMAKFSNLAQTQRRARRIGQELAQAAAAAAPASAALWSEPSATDSLRGAPSKHTYGATESSAPGNSRDLAVEIPPLEEEGREARGPGEVSASFPPGVDFLCLLEVFDHRASAQVLRLLGPCYEHILYDVGTCGLLGCSALKLLNSGLFLASRYPILAVEYHCYPNGRGEDAFAAKGLLCVQVQVGASQGQRIVGYLNCTHMHAPEADAQIRYEQLTLGLHWAQLFQDGHAQPGDVVAFDVYCGDLNFDNSSPDDELEQAHHLFDVYTDPCRLAPRRDKPWAIGTLLNSLEMYNEAVATPVAMKRTLDRAEGRRKFLAAPILASGRPEPSASWSEGRRIDYILYREHPSPARLQTVVEKVSFITQLATCSDHLPVGLQLLVTPTAQPGE